MKMLNGGSPQSFTKNILRGVKDILVAVGSTDARGLVSVSDLGETATELAERLGYLDLQVTEHDGPLPKYPNGTVGVSAEPSKLIVVWVDQYKKHLDGNMLDLGDNDSIIRVRDGARLVVVIITDTNVVSDSSVLGNDKGVFHTTATVLKVR